MRHLLVLCWATMSLQQEMPLRIDSDDVAYYSADYDLNGLHWALETVFNLSHRCSGPYSGLLDGKKPNPSPRPLLESQISRGSGSHYTAEYKLRMDLDQAHYLAEAASDGSVREFFRTAVVPVMSDVLQSMPSLDALEATRGMYPFSASDRARGIDDVYNRALYVPAVSEVLIRLQDTRPKSLKRKTVPTVDALSNMLSSSKTSSSPPSILHPKFDAKKVVRDWETSSPHIAVVDEVLSPEALAEVRRILLESTVWYQTKLPNEFGTSIFLFPGGLSASPWRVRLTLFEIPSALSLFFFISFSLRTGSYAGAYIDDGLHQRLLLALAFDLHKALPGIMAGHDLR